MARPRDADSGATCEQVLRAAAELLESGGVSKLSLRAVAEHAGVGLGTVTYYFSNKQGLLEACLDEGYRWLAEQVGKALAGIVAGEDAGQWVERLTRKCFRHGRTQRELIRMRLATTMQRGALPEQRLNGELLHIIGLIDAALGGPERTELRLAVHSFELLIARYAAHTDEEIQRISGVASLPQALTAVEDHLVQVALALFRKAGIEALNAAHTD